MIVLLNSMLVPCQRDDLLLLFLGFCSDESWLVWYSRKIWLVEHYFIVGGHCSIQIILLCIDVMYGYVQFFDVPIISNPDSFLPSVAFSRPCLID